jgi:hypothetical protein
MLGIDITFCIRFIAIIHPDNIGPASTICDKLGIFLPSIGIYCHDAIVSP